MCLCWAALLAACAELEASASCMTNQDFGQQQGSFLLLQTIAGSYHTAT